MLNLSPSDKKLLALLLLVFAIILSVIVLDFVLNTQVFFKSASNIDMSEWENNIQEILEGPKNTQPAMIRKALHNFFDLMNDKNYEELYLLLSKDFKKNKFKDDFELFTKFMESYGDEAYSPYFNKYYRFGNSYMVLVNFVPSSNTDEDVIKNKKAKKTDTFIINFTDESTYTFSFLRYVGEKELGHGVENSMFRVILDKTILYKTSSEFYFTVTNNTDSNIVISPNSIACLTGLKARYYPYQITIPANSSKDFCFSVGTGLSIADAVPDQIYFKGINVGGNDYSFEIDTKFCLDI